MRRTGFAARLSKVIADHWHGRTMLARSFWINFIGISGMIWLATAGALRYADPSRRVELIIYAVTFAVYLVVLFPWQIIGMLRSCERYRADYGSLIWARAAQFIAVLSLGAVAVTGIGIAQTMLRREPRTWARDQGSEYSLTIDADRAELRLSGTLEVGIVLAVRELLMANPLVTKVRLDSDGGRIYAARGLYRLFQANGLDTVVSQICYSACTLAFMGGNRRHLEFAGRLGFHGYRLVQRYPLPHIDVRAEQREDRARFIARGVAAEFVEKIYSVHHGSLWIPDPAELLRAGVIQGFD